MVTKLLTHTKQLFIFTILLLTFSQLAGQTFTASQNQSDLFIDVNWSLDVDPCLLNPAGAEYDRVRVRLKSNGVQILEEIYEAEDLEPFYGPTQPNFSYVSSETSNPASYTVSGHNTLTNFTFEAWCRRKAFSNGYRILRDANNREIFFGSANIIRFRKNNNTTNVLIDSMPDTFEPTDWYHIAIVNNADLNKILVYINGELLGEVPNENLNGTSALTFLQREAAAINPQLEFAEIRLWNDIRTASEINSFYLFPSSFPQSNLLARWNVTASGISNDLSTIEGSQTITKTGTFSNLVYIPTPQYSPITGTFRDNVGPGLNRNYELLLNYGVFGQTEADCSGLLTSGNTLPIQAPTINASGDFFDRIKINYTNHSDLPSRLDLVRDDTLILASHFAPITKGQMFNYTDSFDIDNPNSVVSDYPHTYHVRMTNNQNASITNFPFDYGTTRLTLFNIYNNNNNLQLSWEYELPSGYSYEIWRGGRRLAVVPGSSYNYTDTKPILGDTIEYQLRAVKDTRIYLLVKSNAYLPPNGKISGQVITQNGNYPIQNVTVTATRSSTNQTFNTVTNDLGFFEINSVPFGLKDSFLLTANLGNHTFNYPTPYVTLDQNNPEKEGVIILDNFEYAVGNEVINIGTLSVTPVANLDKVDIIWNATTTASQPVVELTRNGTLIFREKGSNFLAHSITDLGGTPNKLTDYKLRIYSFDANNKVSEASQSHVIAYPEVSFVPFNDFIAVVQTSFGNPTGNVIMNWTESSTNFDGYKIYRNGTLIATLANNVFTYTDNTALYNTDYEYSISKIRKVDNATFEGNLTTTYVINLGPIPSPTNVLAVPNTTAGYMDISWFNDPAFINQLTVYTGFYIYRNNKKIGFSIKGQPNVFRDMTGLDSMYLYGVSLYKQYPDGNIIESDITSDVSMKQYPLVPGITPSSYTLTQNKTGNQNEVFLDWNAPLNAVNYDGYIISKNGNLLGLVPPEVTSYYDNAPLPSTSQYVISTYKFIEGTYKEGNVASKISTITPYSSPLPNPTNVLVSTSYPHGAKISWEYDPFIPAEFIIYKNNTVLDTISTESRSYFDYTSTYETLPRYKVCAYYSGPLTPNVEKSAVLGTTAKYNQRVLVYGRIVDTNTKLGIPFSQIKISVDGLPYRLGAIADSLGFYKLDLDRHKAGNYSINFQISAGTCYDCISQSLLIQPTKETYALNVEYAINIPVNNDKIAKVVGINGHPNYYDLHNIIYWNMSNNNYDGIEVIKGLEKLPTVMLGDQLIIVDTLPVPGITYKYALRPYKMEGNKKIVSDYFDFDFTTPEFLPVADLTATPRSDLNNIQIEWGHTINNADYYVVLRNGSLYTQVNSNQPLRVIDSTGIPGEIYEYEILGIKTRGSNTFVSTGVKTSAMFPKIGQPIGLTAEIPFLTNVPGGFFGPYPTYNLNHVLLNWDYNDEHVQGFNIYRNGEFVSTVDGTVKEYRDYEGTPGVIIDYSITPKILRNGNIIEGQPAEVSILFPELSDVSHIMVTERSNLGDVKLNFQYNMPGADGFRIERIVDGVYTTIKNITYDSTIAIYEFIDRTDPRAVTGIYAIYPFKNIDGIEYSTIGALSQIFNFPTPPPVLSYDVTDTYTGSIDIHTWTALDSAYFDGFQVKSTGGGNVIATFDKYTRRELVEYALANIFDPYVFTISTYRNLSGSNKVSSTLVSANRNSVSLTTVPSIKAINVIASDGTQENTTITWDQESNCSGCNPTNWNIFRDKILVGTIPIANDEFVDDPQNLLPGISEAIKGRKYVYEVCTCNTHDVGNTDFWNAGDIGHSRSDGKITGHVYARQSTKGVPNVKVTAIGIDTEFNNPIAVSATTQADGSFTLENLYYGEIGTKFKLIAEYLDHEFQLPDSIAITPNNPTYFGAVIYDLTTFIISGVVKKDDALCGEANILVEYRELISDVNFVRDSVRTEADGSYSFVVNPNAIGLTQISITVPNVQTIQDEEGNEKSVLYDFDPNTQNVFNNINNFPQFTTVNFTDNLKYEVDIDIKNACSFPIANQPIEIRVYTDDGCYDQNFITNAAGNFTANLPVFNYKVVVTGYIGGGVTNVENAAKNYLELRPSNFYLLNEHSNAEGGIVDSDFVVKMIYHKAPTINMQSEFNRFLCDDPFNPPIIEQGTEHSLTFTISEEHQGNVCLVSDGYLSIRNAASSDLAATIINHNGTFFPAYTFIARGPNIIAPHVYDLSLQYFNNDDILQGTFSTGLIVEGSTQLPGTGIQTVADSEDGQVKLPLFVLRDPPGDSGYTEIAAGTTISQEVVISKNDVRSGGFTIDGNIAGGFVALLGTFFQREVQRGTETSTEASYSFDITTTQSFATSSEEDAVGREASVVVGTGLSTQYGLQRKLVFEDNCTPIASTRIGYGIGGFESEFVYTIGFIEGLVEKYNQDIELIRDGLLTLVDSDGTILTEDIAVLKTQNLRDTWIEMLNYFDRNTVPHYVLCSDNNIYKDLPQVNQSAYLGWRNGFCNLIGEYEGETFIMDEEITWTQDLITAYNNTIAYTDFIKSAPDISTAIQFTTGNLNNPALFITQQYNATLGANLKSATTVDVTGGSGGYTRTVESQQSSYTSYSLNTFRNVERAGGLYLTAGADYELGGFEAQVFSSDNSIGYRSIIESSVGTSATSANSAFSSITYNISDNDAEDQIATLILQAPLQNHSPYFIRLGGQSSCPYETALTPNEDNDPLKVDDPGIAVVVDPVTGSTTPFPPKQFFIEQGQAGVFTVRVSNSSGITVPRDVEVFLDQNSNPLGAMVTLGGTNLNNGNKILTEIPAFGSLDQLLLIERPSASPYYDFNDILIGIRDVCDGEAQYISVSVNFRLPCSAVSLVSPIDQFVVNRQNPNDALDREVIPFEIRDYNSSNLNLQYIQLQYRRLGDGSNWQNVPGGIFTRTFLKNIDDMNVPGTFPSFFWEWDITGQYALVPDGDYQLRALAFCGTGGINSSLPINGSIRRSIILNQGFPQPADKIFTIGDEISATYVTDIDCDLYNSLDSIDNHLTLFDVTTGLEVPFTFTCFENKISLQISGNISDYDGHVLKVNYYSIGNIAGNIAPNIEWTFRVVTQLLDWSSDSLVITLIEGNESNLLTNIMNTSGMVVNNVQLSNQSNLLTTNPTGITSVPMAGMLVNVNVDANNIPGTYFDTIFIDGLMGRRPALPVKIIILPAPVIPLINPNLPDSMLLNVNWRFVLDPQTSKDTFDVIYALINGEVRGYGNIEKIGPFYAAQLYIFGDSLENEGDAIEFGVYNSDEDLLYENLSYSNITWNKNEVWATVADPEVLLIDSTILDLSRGIIYVDESNNNSLQDGITWNTAFSSLQDALAIAITGDTIWMAEGIYKPTDNNDRSISFEINAGVAIFGGFHTGDTSYGQRGNNTLTMISGDVSPGGNSADYSYHVMKNNTSAVLLDNLTIQDGNANGNGINASGAGLLNNGNITLKNIRMRYCYADGQGAFIDNDGAIFYKGGSLKILSNQSSVIVNRSGANLTIENEVRIED